MVAVPAEIPVTSPVLLIVAMAGMLDDHTPLVVVEANWEVPPMHTACRPLTVPALSGALTITDRVAVAIAQPEFMV